MINLFDYLSLDFTKVSRRNQYIILASFLLLIYIIMSIMRPSPHLIYDSSVLKFDSFDLYQTDELTLGSTFYFFSIEKSVMSFLDFISPGLLVLIFILIYLLSIYLLNDIFDQIRISKDIVFLSSLFLTISPFVLYNIFSLNYYIISLLLIIVTLHMDLKYRNNYSNYWVFVFLLIIPFIEFESALVFYSFYFFYQLTFRKFNLNLLMASVFSFVLYLFFTFQKVQFLTAENFFNFRSFDPVYFTNNLISDFGSVSGTNIFFLILAFVGLYGIILMRSKLKFMFIFLLLMIIYELFIPFDNSFYLSFFLTILASMGYILFKDRNWNELEIKNFTLLLVFCGLLFSMTSYQLRMGEFEMNSEQSGFFDLFNALSDRYLNFENGVYSSTNFNGNLSGALIATNQKYSNLIKMMGGTVMADIDDDLIESIDSTHALKKLFESTDLTESIEVIREYDIDYLYITKEMTQGLQWNHPREGLLINLRNRDLFSPVVQTDQNQIYRINKEYFLN